MANEAFCVFCLKKKGKLLLFTTDKLEKCKALLICRKAHNLAGKDTILPETVNDIQQYHSSCSSSFQSIPQKYRVEKQPAIATGKKSNSGIE